MFFKYEQLVFCVLINQIICGPLIFGPVRQSRDVSQKCNYLIPGILQMYRGVDVTQLDLFHGDDGYKDTLFDTVCDPNIKLNYDGHEVDRPLELKHVIESPDGDFGNDVVFQKSMEDIKKSLSNKFGLDIETGVFSFSSSPRYTEDRQTVEEEKKSLITRYENVYIYEAQLKDVSELDVGEDFKSDFNDLPATYEKDPEKYFQFIKDYGTHYFYKANFGGVLRMRVEISDNFHKTISKDELLAKVEAKYKAGPAFINMSLNNTEDLDKYSTTIWHFHGGEVYSSSSNFSDWVPTVRKDPLLIAGKLRPITTVCEKYDANKSKELAKAIDTHIKRSYLIDEIKPKLTNIISNQGVGYQSAKLYRRELNQLTSDEYNDLTKFSTEMHELFNPPRWWIDDVRLQMEIFGCYKENKSDCRFG